MKDRVSSIGGMFTALLAGSCCIGPVLFLVFGITGIGFLSSLEVFRPYLIIATVVSMAVSHYYAYGKGAHCEPTVICNPRTLKIKRFLFWALVGFAIFGVSFPYVTAWLLI